MKNRLLFFFLVILMFACKRSDNRSDTGSGNLLLKIVDSSFNRGTPDGVDSTVYTYDAGGNLIKRVFDYGLHSNLYHDEVTYTRDDRERTVSFTETIIDPVSYAPVVFYDTTVTQVNYKSGSDQIDYLFSYKPGSAATSGDSIVYDYAGAQISATRDFLITPDHPAVVATENSYGYDGAGVLTGLSTDTQDTTGRADYTFTHDGKINPLVLGFEELPTKWYAVSMDNVTQQVFHSPYYGSTYTHTETFTYRSDGRPLTAVSGGDAQVAVTRSTYFYH